MRVLPSQFWAGRSAHEPATDQGRNVPHWIGFGRDGHLGATASRPAEEPAGPPCSGGIL